MIQGDMLYEGKAKKIFLTDKADEVVQYFKDDATAFNAQKKGTILEKGVVNNKISSRLFELLEEASQCIIFIKKFDQRRLNRQAFFKAKPFDDAARGLSPL